MRKVGDKEAVYYGEAEHTAGGLRREDLIINKKGKIVSRAQHEAGKRKIEHMRSVQSGGMARVNPAGLRALRAREADHGGSFRSFLERANPAPHGGSRASDLAYVFKHWGKSPPRGGNWFSKIHVGGADGGYLFSHNPGQSLEHHWLEEEAR